MKRIITIVGILIVVLGGIALVFTGCQLLPGGNPTSAKNLALLASGMLDYRDETAIAASSKLDVDDLDGKGVLTSKSLTTKTRTITRDDGTVVTIVEVIDDKNTPSDPTDDMVTVTRSYDIWGGNEKEEKIVRPLKPKSSWDVWDANNQYEQTGITIESFINNVKVSTGTMDITWRKSGDQVSVAKIVKETQAVGRNGAINRVVIEVDENGLQKKTRYRIKVTGEGEVVVHSFTYEEYIGDDGNTYMKIIRDDGSYAIVISKKNPRIVEYYTGEGILRMKVTETRDSTTGDLSVVKEIYDNEGNLVRTRNLTFSFEFVGDTVIVTKTFDNGRKVVMTVEESDNGFTVNRNGFVYNVAFQGSDIVISDEKGNLIATVKINEDGTWTVVYPDKEPETVTL